MSPHNFNSVQWTQSLGYSRQACARIFRDGGSAADALRAFGIDKADVSQSDWARAVDLIAASLCQRPTSLAA